MYILYIPLSYILWICEIFWDDSLNYNATHGVAYTVVSGGNRGGETDEMARREEFESSDGWEGEGWQDTDSDNDPKDLNQELEPPKTPPQHTKTETAKIDSVMQGQLYQREANSTAWDEGASPKARLGFTRKLED
jgi:hypothetical protein